MIKEIYRKCASGYLVLVILPGLLIANAWVFYRAVLAENIFLLTLTVITAVVLVVCSLGFFMVKPNQSRVLTLFGTYVGSARETELRWANPFYSK